MDPNTAQLNSGMAFPTIPANMNTNIPLMSIEQQNYYTNEMRKQERAYFEKRIKEEYPVIYPIIYTIILVFNSICLIVLHIILIIFNGAFHYVYHGIWGGALSILLAVFVILPIKIHNIYIFIASMASTVFIGMFLNIGIMIASAMSFMDYGSAFSIEEANKDMIPVTALMIALSAISAILSIVNFFLIKKLTKKPKVGIIGNAGFMTQQNMPSNFLQSQNVANQF